MLLASQFIQCYIFRINIDSHAEQKKEIEGKLIIITRCFSFCLFIKFQYTFFFLQLKFSSFATNCRNFVSNRKFVDEFILCVSSLFLIHIVKTRTLSKSLVLYENNERRVFWDDGAKWRNFSNDMSYYMVALLTRWYTQHIDNARCWMWWIEGTFSFVILIISQLFGILLLLC